MMGHVRTYEREPKQIVRCAGCGRWTTRERCSDCTDEQDDR